MSLCHKTQLHCIPATLWGALWWTSFLRYYWLGLFFFSSASVMLLLVLFFKKREDQNLYTIYPFWFNPSFSMQFLAQSAERIWFQQNHTKCVVCAKPSRVLPLKPAMVHLVDLYDLLPQMISFIGSFLLLLRNVSNMLGYIFMSASYHHKILYVQLQLMMHFDVCMHWE